MSPSSPRKAVPLSDEPSVLRDSGPALTRRAFFCDVVVESGYSPKHSQDVHQLLRSLGERMTLDSDNNLTSSPLKSSGSSPDVFGSPSKGEDGTYARSKREPSEDLSVLLDVIGELISTERSYVHRLRLLKKDYADPLRLFARAKDTAIVPPYEAKTLFGNIDQLLPANEAFLADLEAAFATHGPRVMTVLGDVALKHFKTLKTFDCYRQYYSKREEAQAIFEREIAKKSSTGFAGYIDHIKYSNPDAKNRVGLRELLMDPVQRIPRYTLLFRTIIKYMPLGDSQRERLIEADECASKIASCETDEQTKRAALMHCLERSVEGFPPSLISHSRRFIDCVDVEDVPVEQPTFSASTSGAGAIATLQCTLFLFDDRLMIVKRNTTDKPGRTLAGLDEANKAARGGGLMNFGFGASSAGGKRSGMSCKGVVDITDIVATDVGDGDFHLYLEKPPQDQSERWSHRPFRSYSVVIPPRPPNLDPKRTLAEKTRFLENLWLAQAMYRTRQGRSVALSLEEKDTSSTPAGNRRRSSARTYFNLYERRQYLTEPKKAKVILHVDPGAAADQLPFGTGTGPYVIIRAQPMPGELCRYTVTSSDPNDDGESDIVHTVSVSERVVQTINQYGLFKFRTAQDSRPSTPTANASTRSRNTLFSLDAISRGLFSPSKIGGEGFTSISHKRSRSAMSRASSATTETSFKFSQRSNSTMGSSVPDEDSMGHRGRRTSKRGKSPGLGYTSEPERERSISRMSPDKTGSSYAVSDEEAFNVSRETLGHPHGDNSEFDLSMRLELARKNSQSQGQAPSKQPERLDPTQLADTILEEEPPAPWSSSREHRARDYERPTTPVSSRSRPESTTPTRGSRPSSPSKSHSRPRTPLGPRSPPTSPTTQPFDLHRTSTTSTQRTQSSIDTVISMIPEPVSRVASPPMSRLTSAPPTRARQPLEPAASSLTNGGIATPKASATATKAPGSVEPLAIKKKNSVKQPSPRAPRRSTDGAWSRARRSSAQHGAGLPNPESTVVTPKATPSVSKVKPVKTESWDRLTTIAETTREDVDSSRRAVKRIKIEVENLKAKISSDASSSKQKTTGIRLPTSGIPRPTQIPNLANRYTESRMEEMRNMIQARKGGGGLGDSIRRSASESSVVDDMDWAPLEEKATAIQALVTEAERETRRTQKNYETLGVEVKALGADYKEKCVALGAAQVELSNAKMQSEVMKQLYADAQAENDIMYEAFNEELDGMFNDANLPETDAWSQLTTDLRRTKDDRNKYAKENSRHKRRIHELEAQNEHHIALLRSHGLIP